MMKVKEIVINTIAIGTVVILPHLALIPNFGYTLPILLMVWIALKYSGENFSDVGFSLARFKPNAILIGSLAAIIFLAFMQLIFFPILENMVTLEYNDQGLNDTIRENQWQYFFMVLMGWLVGGFYEEFVFHGFIFTRLERMIQGRYSSHISFVVTALVFGFYHIQLDALGVINALLGGAVYLGLFLYFDRNLWYSIICHGVYNMLVMTLIYYGYL